MVYERGRIADHDTHLPAARARDGGRFLPRRPSDDCLRQGPDRRVGLAWWRRLFVYLAIFRDHAGPHDICGDNGDAAPHGAAGNQRRLSLCRKVCLGPYIPGRSRQPGAMGPWARHQLDRRPQPRRSLQRRRHRLEATVLVQAMKRALRVVSALALSCGAAHAQETISVGGQSAFFNSGNTDLDSQLAETWANLQQQIQAQHLRDHPEDSPDAIAARIASHPDVVAQAEKQWADDWDRQNPLKTSFDRPPAPTYFLDDAVRAAIAREQPDPDQRIRDLEVRIQQLEQEKQSRAARRTIIPAPNQQPGAVAPALRGAPQPAAAERPKGTNILTRTLPDGRVMMLAGSQFLYFPNQAAADVAAKKIQREALQAASNSLGGDTAPGTAKELPIEHNPNGVSNLQDYREESTVRPAVRASDTAYSDAQVSYPVIISAEYGVEGAFKDVTNFAQAAVKKGAWRADSTTLGGDPVFGRVKTLKVRYEMSDRVYDNEFTEGSEVRLIGASAAREVTAGKLDERRPNDNSAGSNPGSAPEPASKQPPLADGSSVSGVLKILSASYGAESTFQDVTPFVQNNVRKGSCSMRVGNDTLGGDPIGGKTKILTIRYQIGTQIHEATFTEGSEVRIP